MRREQGRWQFQHANGTLSLPDYGDQPSEAYILAVLRDIAERQNAASTPVGVLYDPAVT
jgi:hypothetical protein